MMTAIASLYLTVVKWVDTYGQPALLLGTRLWLAKVFFAAGLTKIKTWDTTLMLFEYEYDVPVIPTDIAAYMATAGELILPILLVLGLGTRFAAAGLFILNAVAAISYPDISIAGMKDHYLWGFMALVLVVYGGGRVALDNWLCNRFFRELWTK